MEGICGKTRHATPDGHAFSIVSTLEPRNCCAQALPSHARGIDDTDLLALAEKENWRRCPRCGTMVERIEGCSFIRCK